MCSWQYDGVATSHVCVCNSHIRLMEESHSTLLLWSYYLELCLSNITANDNTKESFCMFSLICHLISFNQKSKQNIIDWNSSETFSQKIVMYRHMFAYVLFQSVFNKPLIFIKAIKSQESSVQIKYGSVRRFVSMCLLATEKRQFINFLLPFPFFITSHYHMLGL